MSLFSVPSTLINAAESTASQRDDEKFSPRDEDRGGGSKGNSPHISGVGMGGPSGGMGRGGVEGKPPSTRRWKVIILCSLDALPTSSQTKFSKSLRSCMYMFPKRTYQTRTFSLCTYQLIYFPETLGRTTKHSNYHLYGLVQPAHADSVD